MKLNFMRTLRLGPNVLSLERREDRVEVQKGDGQAQIWAHLLDNLKHIFLRRRVECTRCMRLLTIGILLPLYE